MNKQKTNISRNTNMSIIATALLSFCGILSETSMNVTFSTLTNIFNLPLGTLQWITTAYLLSVAITMTTSATLKQSLNERIIFLVAFLCFILGSFVAMATNNFVVMIIGRLLQGMGTGVSMPLMFNIIAERIPKERMGFYMGMGGLIMGLAPAFGPTYGGYMIANAPWQWIFIAIIPVAIIAFIIGFIFIENSPKKGQKRSFNVLNFILLAISLSTLLLDITSLEHGSFNWTYIILSIIAMIIFIILSSKDKTPFLDITLFRHPIILFGIMPFAIYQFSNLSANFVIPNFLTMALGLGSSLAGFALLPGTLFGTFTEPIFGKLYDEKGPKLSLYTGNALILVSACILSLFIHNVGFMMIIILYIVFTIGRNMSFNNTMAAVLNEMPKEKSADITAIFQMIQQFAGALGTAISAVIVETASNVSNGSQTVFQMISVLMVLNFISFFKLFKHFNIN